MIDLLIPLQTPSGNVRERQHWSAQRRDVTKWATWFLYSMRPGTTDLAKGKRHVAITSFRVRRCSDDDNLITGCKALKDGMVRAGLLVDDSMEWATFTYAQDVASKSPTGKPCTRIVITESPNQPTTGKE